MSGKAASPCYEVVGFLLMLLFLQVPRVDFCVDDSRARQSRGKKERTFLVFWKRSRKEPSFEKMFVVLAFAVAVDVLDFSDVLGAEGDVGVDVEVDCWDIVDADVAGDGGCCEGAVVELAALGGTKYLPYIELNLH